LECRAVFGFKDSQAGVEQFAFRHDDDIEPWRNLVSTKHLSYQSFSSVSYDGAAEFFGGRDAQASNRAAVWKNKQRGITAVNSRAALIDLLKFDAAADVLVGPEPSQV
jgi:hypothetical protein